MIKHINKILLYLQNYLNTTNDAFRINLFKEAYARAKIKH